MPSGTGPAVASATYRLRQGGRCPGETSRTHMGVVHPGVFCSIPPMWMKPSVQGLGKVGGVWSDVRGCRRVGADAARPRRDDGRCLIVLDHGGPRRHVIIGHNRPVAPAPEGAPEGSGRPRGPAGRAPPPCLGPVPCRGGDSGGVPHAGGDARAHRRPGPRRLGGPGPGGALMWCVKRR